MADGDTWTHASLSDKTRRRNFIGLGISHVEGWTFRLARGLPKNLETKVETSASLKDERRVCVSMQHHVMYDASIVSVTWAGWSIKWTLRAHGLRCMSVSVCVCLCLCLRGCKQPDVQLVFDISTDIFTTPLPLSHTHLPSSCIHTHTHTRMPSKDNIQLCASLPPPFSFFISSLPGEASLTNHPRCQGKVVFASHHTLNTDSNMSPGVCFPSGGKTPNPTKTGIPQRPLLKKKLKLAPI